MDDPAVASAVYWLGWIEPIKFWAEVGVAVTISVGVIASFFAAPLSKRVENARVLEIAQLTNETEKLRSKNLELEKAVSPRALDLGAGEKLKPFSHMKIVVLSAPEVEPTRTAGQIRRMLRTEASWQPLSMSPNVKLFWDGVTVHTAGLIPGPDDALQNARSDFDVAQSLVDVLNANGIEANRGNSMPELGVHGIAVLVGLKPLAPGLRRPSGELYEIPK